MPLRVASARRCWEVAWVKPREPQRFRPRPFLFRMLAGIFTAQFVMAGYALVRCSSGHPTGELKISERCPELGTRVENLFGLAVATTLSLLTSIEDEPAP